MEYAATGLTGFIGPIRSRDSWPLSPDHDGPRIPRQVNRICHASAGVESDGSIKVGADTQTTIMTQ